MTFQFPALYNSVWFRIEIGGIENGGGVFRWEWKGVEGNDGAR